MRERTRKLIDPLPFNPVDHPAIMALADFAAANPVSQPAHFHVYVVEPGDSAATY